MSDIVQEVIEAAKLAKPFLWEPDHPQYVEGNLYLLQGQWDAICDAFPYYDRSKWSSRPSLAWGIHVKIIEPNKPLTLPSGKAMVYSAALESFYVFDGSIAADAGIAARESAGGAS